MAFQRNRSGFTFVALLVVIAIIGLLVALLLPAIQTTREPVRGTQCMNNQKQIARSMLHYENSYHAFLGYVNRVGSVETETRLLGSWVVPLFPYCDQNDLWKAWSAGNAEHRRVSWLLCPSDPALQGQPEDTSLSYVANRGPIWRLEIGPADPLSSSMAAPRVAVSLLDNLMIPQLLEEDPKGLTPPREKHSPDVFTKVLTKRDLPSKRLPRRWFGKER